MLFSPFINVDASASRTVTLPFGGFNYAYVTVLPAAFTGTGGKLELFLVNGNMAKLVQTWTNADLLTNVVLDTSFRGCPTDLRFVYTAGTNTGTISINVNCLEQSGL